VCTTCHTACLKRMALREEEDCRSDKRKSKGLSPGFMTEQKHSSESLAFSHRESLEAALDRSGRAPGPFPCAVQVCSGSEKSGYRQHLPSLLNHKRFQFA